MAVTRETLFEKKLFSDPVKKEIVENSEGVVTSAGNAGNAGGAGNLSSPLDVKVGVKKETLHPTIIRAYKLGTLSKEKREEVDRGLESGKFQFPEGENGEEYSDTQKFIDMFTGSIRETDYIKNMGDIGDMPEMSMSSVGGAIRNIITSTSGPEETVKILKKAFPDMKTKRDVLGNIVLKSSIDGKTYAIKPGMTKNDLFKALMTIASFVPAGRVASAMGRIGAAVSTQGGHELLQKLFGGEINLEEIALAGAFEGAGEVLGAGVRGVKNLNKSKKSTEDVFKEATSETTGNEFLSDTQKILAEKADPDPDIIKAAEDQGVSHLLGPEHVSGNKQFVDIVGAVKSFPGSPMAAAEVENMRMLRNQVDEKLNEISGFPDISYVSDSVKNNLEKLKTKIKANESKAFSKINNNIPREIRFSTEHLKRYFEDRFEYLGKKYGDKKSLKMLMPGERKIFERFLKKNEGVSYGFIDENRRALTQSRVKKNMVFFTAPDRQLLEMEKALLNDQRDAASRFGLENVFDEARKLSLKRHQIQKSMTDLFGRSLENSILRPLRNSSRALSNGDIQTFRAFLDKLPEGEERKKIVAAGVSQMFRTSPNNQNINFNSYKRWYDNLKRTPAAMKLLKENLPPKGVKVLEDFYKISVGIQRASQANITTGRLATVMPLRGIDNFISSSFGKVARSTIPGGGGMADAIGRMMDSASGAKNTRRNEAAMSLLNSKAFRDFIFNTSKGKTDEAVGRFASTNAFKIFWKRINGEGPPRSWIKAAMTTGVPQSVRAVDVPTDDDEDVRD